MEAGYFLAVVLASAIEVEYLHRLDRVCRVCARARARVRVCVCVLCRAQWTSGVYQSKRMVVSKLISLTLLRCVCVCVVGIALARAVSICT